MTYLDRIPTILLDTPELASQQACTRIAVYAEAGCTLAELRAIDATGGRG